MTTMYKVVKACAIALSALIILSIASAICSAIVAMAGIDYISDFFEADNGERKFQEDTIDIETVQNLNVESGIGEFVIETSEEFKVVAENVSKNYSCKVENGTLKVIDKTKNVLKFNDKNTPKITVYIPESFYFDTVNLDLGVGETNISSLKADRIDIDCGAGELNVDYLEAREKISIDGGVGEFTIKDSVMNDLDFDAGVGESNITAKLTGKCEIDTGVGQTIIKLIDFDESKGKITTNKGIGEIRVNGRSAKPEDSFGNGNEDIIKISGGVGEIKLEY